jgi:hypothetical protein
VRKGYNMNYLPPLEELDADAAIREGAESVDGNIRADFLRRAGLEPARSSAGARSSALCRRS